MSANPVGQNRMPSQGASGLDYAIDAALPALGAALIALLPLYLNRPTEILELELILEALGFTAAAVAFLFVRRLRIRVLTLGWALTATSLLADCLDELTAASELYNMVEGTFKATGYSLVAVGLFLSYRTILEQLGRSQRAEEALRESEEQFRALFEEAPVGYHEVDTDGVIKRANRAVHRMLGAENGSLVRGRVDELLCTQSNRGRSVAGLLGHWRNGDSRIREVCYRHSDGKPRTMEVHENVIRDSSGELRGIRTALLDVTDRKLMEKESERLNAQLRQAQKLETIGTLTGGIAHDFNNLLVPIIGNVDLALRDIAPDTALEEDLKQVMNCAQRAKRLVQQLLAMSRDHEEDEKREPVSLKDLIEEASVFLRASVPSTIEIQSSLADECPPVLGDSTQLQQVFMNLCTNAAHAMRQNGGTLSIELAPFEASPAYCKYHPTIEPGPHVRLEVRDTGCGIPADERERVFDPFFTTKQVGEGTGLGLSIAHGIVSAHGGVIAVESTVDVGSTFTITLPAAERTTHVEQQHGHHSLTLGSGTVLVVDDEPSVARVTTRLLQRSGYRVEVAADGLEALELIRNVPHRFDLVLTDQTMPRMTGLQLCLEIRRVQPDIPVILTTGYSDMLTEVSPENLGISKVLMKPVELCDLAAAVKKSLETSKSPRRF